jgi:hypothetical protein
MAVGSVPGEYYHEFGVLPIVAVWFRIAQCTSKLMIYIRDKLVTEAEVIILYNKI